MARPIPRDAPVTRATLPSRIRSLISSPDNSLRAATRRHRPAVDHLIAAADPYPVVEVEGRTDLSGDEIEAAPAGRRSRPVEDDRRVLVADRNLGCLDANRDRRAILEPDHAPADVDHHPIWVP